MPALGPGKRKGRGSLSMSVFEYRKPPADQQPHDLLRTLQTTLARLEAESEQTPQMTHLKRILAGRITELERQSIEARSTLKFFARDWPLFGPVRTSIPEL